MVHLQDFSAPLERLRKRTRRCRSLPIISPSLTRQFSSKDVFTGWTTLPPFSNNICSWWIPIGPPCYSCRLLCGLLFVDRETIISVSAYMHQSWAPSCSPSLICGFPRYEHWNIERKKKLLTPRLWRPMKCFPISRVEFNLPTDVLNASSMINAIDTSSAWDIGKVSFLGS